MRIVLASASPWRAKLLRDAGIPCETVAPDVDESAVTGPDPASIALARALAKARAVAEAGVVTIGADQVAHLDGLPFGKPTGPDDHRARLRQLRGRTHTLTTGVAIVHTRVHTLLSHTTLRFRADLCDEELDAYVASGEGSGCAGGYMAEGRGAQLIEHIDGDWFNVIGLPLFAVITELRRLGWRPDLAHRTGPA